jgi:hypothetical protein
MAKASNCHLGESIRNDTEIKVQIDAYLLNPYYLFLGANSPTCLSQKQVQ